MNKVLWNAIDNACLISGWQCCSTNHSRSKYYKFLKFLRPLYTCPFSKFLIELKTLQLIGGCYQLSWLVTKKILAKRDTISLHVNKEFIEGVSIDLATSTRVASATSKHAHKYLKCMILCKKYDFYCI